MAHDPLREREVASEYEGERVSRLPVSNVWVSRLREEDIGGETSDVVTANLMYAGVLRVSGTLRASSARGASSVERLAVVAREPWNTQLHGKTLARAVDQLRECVSIAVTRQLLPRGVDPADDAPEAEDARKVGSMFQKLLRRPARQPYDDATYVPFAREAIKLMRRPQTDFVLRQAADSRTYYATGLWGRLTGPYRDMSPSTVRRWQNECFRRGLITIEDGVWTPTPKLLALTADRD